MVFYYKKILFDLYRKSRQFYFVQMVKLQTNVTVVVEGMSLYERKLINSKHLESHISSNSACINSEWFKRRQCTKVMCDWRIPERLKYI